MNKMLKLMLTSLTVLLLAGGLALIAVLYVTDEEDSGNAQSIDEVVEYSYKTPEVTTNLQDGSFVRIQFQVIAENNKAKKELQKREFQLQNILIKELSKMKKQDFQTGLSDLEDMVQLKLNKVMTEGAITDVYTINKILQ
ncbi:flagellar basal body-associated protein FliL [Lentibacillus lipolyticus]|nr:flagellar basal body-associated protein FliL [Lentibacillus lipolyticus]